MTSSRRKGRSKYSIEAIQRGKALAIAREAAGLTQDAAGEALGVSDQTVYRWESGDPVKDRDLAAMERLYNLTPGTLLPVDRANKMVPRGTLAIIDEDAERSELTPQLAEIAEDFKRCAQRAGATDAEVRRVHRTLYYENQFAYRDEQGALLPLNEREFILTMQIGWLRRWVERRIAGRAPGGAPSPMLPGGAKLEEVRPAPRPETEEKKEPGA